MINANDIGLKDRQIVVNPFPTRPEMVKSHIIPLVWEETLDVLNIPGFTRKLLVFRYNSEDLW